VLPSSSRRSETAAKSINRKAVYTIRFDADELMPGCIAAIDGSPLETSS